MHGNEFCILDYTYSSLESRFQNLKENNNLIFKAVSFVFRVASYMSWGAVVLGYFPNPLAIPLRQGAKQLESIISLTTTITDKRPYRPTLDVKKSCIKKEQKCIE